MGKIARVVPGKPHQITQRRNRRQTAFLCDERLLGTYNALVRWLGA
jgi:hypothetical protein